MAKVAPADTNGVIVTVKASASTASGHERDFNRSSSSSSGSNEAVSGLLSQLRQRARTLAHDSGWYDSVPAQLTRKFLRGKVFGAITIVSLVLALFSGEIFAVAQVSTNDVLDIALTIVFLVFLGEFIGLSLTDASYLLGFFFWMDFLGTASMVFDVSYMAGTDVTEAVRVNQASEGPSQDNVIVVRAARAAKLGARAGRITRVLKILRYLPFLLNKSEVDNQGAKMAKVISMQLTNGLSTRVAFLTICIVVVMPLFTMFTYPEFDDSMGAWTELLSLNAQDYYDALPSRNGTLIAMRQERLFAEVQRFAAFYSSISYGPFRVEYGESLANGTFIPQPGVLDIMSSLSFTFQEPRRLSSSRIVSQGRIQTYFDLSSPYSVEAVANIGLICFIIMIMCCFGLVMSSSISVIALQPLERMLSVVREKCKEIFKYTVDLNDDNSEASDDSEDYEEMEHDSEFVLLEKVVQKLAGIAQVSATNKEPEVKENMTENEIMILNWTQGAQVLAHTGERASAFQKSTMSEDAAETSSDCHSLDGLHGLPMPGAVSKEILESLNTSYFNALDLSKDARTSLATYMINTCHGCAAWVRTNVKQDQLVQFVGNAEAKYNPNPFHSFSHAIDVEYAARRWLRMMDADTFITEIQQFWLLLAAIGHDLGHLGVNNQYLVETSHELAVRYNDRSPLENMHCSKLFLIASDPEANVFSQLEKDVYKEIRKGIIDAILHTDVIKHNEMVKELGLLYQMNQEAFDHRQPGPVIIESHNNAQLILNMLLHGADIGNPMKPWDLCFKYAHLCLDEFFAQGDLEKAAGIPVQMLNDRDKVNRPNSQTGFIEFVIAPMCAGMVNLFPQLDSLAYHLAGNIERWADAWVEDAAPSPEAVAKVSGRVNKVAGTLRALVQSDQVDE